MDNNFYYQNNNFNSNQGYTPQNQPYTPYSPYPQQYYYPQPIKKAPPSKEEKQANKKALISMILGIISISAVFSFIFFPFALFIPQIVSVVFGINAKKDFRKLGKGCTKATVGIVLSSISFVISVILTVAIVFLFYIPIGGMDISTDTLNDEEALNSYVEDYLYDYYSDLFGVDEDVFRQEDDFFYDEAPYSDYFDNYEYDFSDNY